MSFCSLPTAPSITESPMALTEPLNSEEPVRPLAQVFFAVVSALVPGVSPSIPAVEDAWWDCSTVCGFHGGQVGGFLRRFCLGHGYAEQRAGGQNGHECPGPLEMQPSAQWSSRLAERPPGLAQGAAAYRRLDVAVGEIRQDNRCGQAQ